MKIIGLEQLLVGGRLLVVVDTDDGVSGVGESGMPREHAAQAAMLSHLEPLILGQDPFRTEHIWQLLARGSFWPSSRNLSAMISAIDIALWDIKGKVLGVPVYQLLGGQVRDRVACYTHLKGGTDDTSAVVDSALAAAADGWHYLRWGLPTDGDLIEPRRAVRVAVDKFAAVREAVGPEIELLLDVHTRLDPPHAVTLCRELEPMRPFFVEDPLRAENPSAYEMLRLRTGVPLAAGEQFGSKWEFRELIEREWIDYARIDLGNVGGFTEANKIAGWCETHYIDVVLHNPLGPVGTMASLHFNLALPNMAVQELARRPGSDLTDVISGEPTLEGGDLLPPSAPGLGIEVDRDAARRYPPDNRLTPRLKRPDGAVTNW